MDFEKISILCSFLSKNYASGLLRLLYNYRSISASEAASRLNIHNRTAQDFLEAMALAGILDKKEVFEGKRPYFRFTLKEQQIQINIDLEALYSSQERPKGKLAHRIREKRNSGAKFSTARNGQYFSSIVVWIGEGRDNKERKINLTEAQGKFLYNLPFPEAPFLTIQEILEKSGVEEAYVPEILDMIDLLGELDIVERKSG